MLRDSFCGNPSVHCVRLRPSCDGLSRLNELGPARAINMRGFHEKEESWQCE